MSEFNKYSTDGGATFIDVEDSNAVHWSQAEGYVGKNRNSMPYYASSGTTHGITKVINADGTININNTTTGTDFVEFHQRTLHNNNTDLYLPIGDYVVTIEADKTIDVTKSHFTVNRTYNGADVDFSTSKNIGTEYHFSITENTTCDYKKADGSCLVGFYVYFDSGLAFNDVTIKPMIRLSSISDNTFEPWYMSNKELTDTILDFMPGDVYSISLDGRASFCGHITNGGKDLYINIPTLKRFTASLINNITLSFSNNANIIVRGISGYVINNDLTSHYNFSVVKAGTSLNELTLLITNTDNSVFNVLNNTPLSGTINGTLTITFS